MEEKRRRSHRRESSPVARTVTGATTCRELEKRRVMIAGDGGKGYCSKED